MADLLHFLIEMRNGKVALDCNAKFEKLVQAVLDTGVKGKLTLTLELKPTQMGVGGVVKEISASHEIKLALPEHHISDSTFFVGKQGNLTRSDPAQEEMFGEEDIKEAKDVKQNG